LRCSIIFSPFAKWREERELRRKPRRVLVVRVLVVRVRKKLSARVTTCIFSFHNLTLTRYLLYPNPKVS